MAERFARAAWSGIAEPGDLVAGVVVRALGAGPALMALVERHSRSRVLDSLATAGVDEVKPSVLATALERWMPRLTAGSALSSLRLAARCGARLVVPGDEEWPGSFGDLGEHEPLALWVRGDLNALNRMSHTVSLVGARAATGYGEHVAMELSAGLIDRKMGIVSGAAYGIDGMAHRAALASSGFTAAFLAGGVDRFYPSGHDALLTRITKVGAVISELPCGSPPTKWRFLQRNRLIAAASKATVVVEAGSRSGSLNTAAHASSIGRPVGAVPGPVTSLSSAGCHRLLREYGAECVTNADEVMALFTPVSDNEPRLDTPITQAAAGPASERRQQHRSSDEVRLADALSSRAPRLTADIAKRSGLSISRTSSLLGSLSLAGSVVEGERGWKKIEP
ncbi:DNA-processing protein DprA [Subtercola lobariae]|uniref:DNA-processing protein DprA n=1 Tax=Subtercola lobariae TaxID=1588641 RepID=UPI001E3095FA|nr:DNA-processing protein DprA [Subtercola lobariae]